MSKYEIETAKRLLSYLQNPPASRYILDVSFSTLKTKKAKESLRRKITKLEDNVCPIDGRPNPRTIDHDHDTGKVRGVVCKRCNTHLLGAIERSEKEFRRR